MLTLNQIKSIIKSPVVMKKIILLLLGVILSLPAISQPTQGDWDINFKVRNNQRVNG